MKERMSGDGIGRHLGYCHGWRDTKVVYLPVSVHPQRKRSVTPENVFTHGPDVDEPIAHDPSIDICVRVC